MKMSTSAFAVFESGARGWVLCVYVYVCVCVRFACACLSIDQCISKKPFLNASGMHLPFFFVIAVQDQR